VIERLLEAERVRLAGELDRAELLFRQVAEADPQNAIAVVGLAEVALDRGDAVAAAEHTRRALAIDPDEAAARRILDRLTPPASEPEAIETPAAAPAEPAAWPESPAASPESPAASPESPAASPESPAVPEREPARRSWLRRLLDRLFGRRR
jgi:tetratricopeptide (TPR) repeat protein